MPTQSTTPLVTYKPVTGWLGYRVGDDGSVWSCKIKGSITGRLGNWKRMKQVPHGGGYRYVFLKNGRARVQRRYVHELVLTEFLGARPDGMQACHNNGIPHDNRLANLRWDTPAANQADRYKHGTGIKHTCHRGSARPGAKLTEADIPRIRKLLGVMPQRKIAQKFGVHHGIISGIASGRIWSHA